MEFAYFLTIGSLFSQALRPTAVEVNRIHAPDGRVDAVVVERETDATVATPTEIYLVPKGETKVSEGDLVMSGDHFENIAITWDAPKMLDIQYKKGRVSQFKNYWFSPTLDNFEYVVESKIYCQSAHCLK